MDNSEGVNILDAETAIRIEDDKTVFRRTQDIGNHFLSNLADKRLSTQHERMGDLHHVASIPTVIVEKWMAEGFNIFDKNIDLKEIVKRLHSEDMAGLLATDKRLF